MHTRKKYVSNVKKKKEKRITRAAKMLCKGFTYPLPVSLVEDLDGFQLQGVNYSDCAYCTVRTAQTGIVSIQVTQSTSYFLTLHSSTRGTPCLSLSHSLPASMLHPTLFPRRKLSPQSSSSYGYSSSQGLLTSHRLSQGANQKIIHFFPEAKGQKTTAMKLRLCNLCHLLTAKFHCKEASSVYHCFSVFSFSPPKT